ncbi:MAG: cyclic nucleotide-binding domain-containing protein [Deltaproteobacteria bacterium]|nr:cyclic nucleotide-binding domain-containing protein [Deltaproteobacteria bacterium]
MIIHESDLFDGMSEELEAEFVKIMKSESYNPGDEVIKEGDPADYFYILQTGALDVKVSGARSTTHTAIKPGDAVGWSSLAGRDTYTASVECAESSKLIKINKEEVDLVLRRFPAFGLIFYKRLAGTIGERLIQSYQLLARIQEGSG